LPEKDAAMKLTQLGVVCCLVAVLPALPVSADEPTWVGKSVIVRRADVKYESGEAPRDLFFYVRAAEPSRLKARIDGVDQWLAKTDVVLPENAVQYFSDLIEKNPSDADAYLRRGASRAAQNRPEDALKDFDEAVRLDPKSIAARCARGRVRTDQKQLDEAIQDFD